MSAVAVAASAVVVAQQSNEQTKKYTVDPAGVLNAAEGGGARDGKSEPVTPEAGSVAAASEPVASGPNPNGRKGGPEHQAGVTEAEVKLRAKYASDPSIKIRREEKVTTTGGEKGTRYIDVVAVDENNTIIEGIQVGKRTQSGIPVARGRRALQDIELGPPTGSWIGFDPYT